MATSPSIKEDILIDNMNRKIRFNSCIPQKTNMQVVIVHGFAEHMRCYGDTVQLLVDRGIAVHMLDLPGHGLSDGPRGHVDDFVEFLEDLHLCFHSYPHFLKTKPTFLLGHSLGGLIASQYCLHYQPRIKGLILSSPLTGFSSMMSTVTHLLMRVVARRDPAFLIPKPSGVMTLSRDPVKWQRYRNDPYRLRTISPNLYLSMTNQARLLQDRAPEISVPLLLFYTALDQVVSPSDISRFFNNVGSSDKLSVVFTQAMHELFQEQEQRLVLDKMCSWMSERV